MKINSQPLFAARHKFSDQNNPVLPWDTATKAQSKLLDQSRKESGNAALAFMEIFVPEGELAPRSFREDNASQSKGTAMLLTRADVAQYGKKILEKTAENLSKFLADCEAAQDFPGDRDSVNRAVLHAAQQARETVTSEFLESANFCEISSLGVASPNAKSSGWFRFLGRGK